VYLLKKLKVRIQKVWDTKGILTIHLTHLDFCLPPKKGCYLRGKNQEIIFRQSSNFFQK